MNTLKLTSRLAASVMLAAAWSGVAVGQTCPEGFPLTVTYTATFPDEIGDWPTDTLSVPKWTGPAGATLIHASVTLCAQSDGTANFQNNDDDPCVFSYSVTVDMTASPQDGTSPISNTGISLGTSGGPFPLDAGQTGFDNFVSDVECAPGHPQVFTSGPDLLWFTSQPGDTEVLIDHAGVTSSQSFGCGVVDFTTTIFTDVVLTVEYTYCLEETKTTPPPGGCICTGPSPHYRRPGSLLLFPEFDNQSGAVTLITVTNVDCGRQSGDVTIEYRYINKNNCAEFDRTETLTPCDTLTLVTNFHNPGMTQGYVYVYAKDADGNPIVFNHLIGNLLVVSGLDVFDYSVNPVVFRGIGHPSGIVQPDGTLTDLDDDGIRDLDGQEYEPAPDIITVPRFLGQDPLPSGMIQSQVVLIALSGGSQFTTTIHCLLYNDNEEDFSFDHTFYCWEKPFLLDMAPASSNTFLKTTTHDPDEIIGATTREAGWLCCDGSFASSTQETIEDPAFYMVLVERVGTFAVADLPFECGTQINGALLPRDILGDGDPTPVNGDNQ